ncbi:MAG: DUF5716 family protein [Defluviitaleaceae bacterium]|nr:DUF5716 family protein [Defluviitaleaceae bacterium]
MNWKNYKNLNAADKANEAYYIIGLDIGNHSTGIAFYNISDGDAEVIDLSGGYGKPSIPTVMQYIAENKEWVFGEYALLNSGANNGVIITAMVERLGRFDHIDVDGRSISVANILGMFIKEILSNVKNINPNGEIVGIVAAIPAYLSQQAQEELTRAFKIAGYEKELIALVPDRECALASHYRQPPMDKELALVVDFGGRELCGGLYEVAAVDGRIVATSMSSVFNNIVSVAAINQEVSKLFESYLDSETDRLNEHVLGFTHQHKDMLFQKGIRQKPIKLYFNFLYPPVQQTIEHKQVLELVFPYLRGFNGFINDVLDKSLSAKPIRPRDVGLIMCVGGGFEMLWARDAVAEFFPAAKFYKNPKMVVTEGAALVAARRLGIAELPEILLEDRHQLTGDIGITSGDAFLPLVERNSFWWQQHKPKLVLVNEAVSGEVSFTLEKRNTSGEATSIGQVKIDGLPKRPKGATRLEIGVSFLSNKEFNLNVKDIGFGELFPRVDYEQVVGMEL